MASVAVLAALGAACSSNGGWTKAATVDGVTFYTKPAGHNVAVRTSGRLGDLVNEVVSPGQAGCDMASMPRSVCFGLVPKGTQTATAGGKDFRVVSAHGRWDLAVYFPTDVPLPSGRFSLR